MEIDVTRAADIDEFVTCVMSVFGRVDVCGSVHGMCGYCSAVTALRRVFRTTPPEALRL